MQKIACALACLACAGHGRRLPISIERVKRWPSAKSQDAELQECIFLSEADANQSDARESVEGRLVPLRALAHHPLELPAAAAFNPSSPGSISAVVTDACSGHHVPVMTVSDERPVMPLKLLQRMHRYIWPDRNSNILRLDAKDHKVAQEQPAKLVAYKRSVRFKSFEDSLDVLYEESFKIKCPFFRKRAFDTLEAMKSILFFILARHKSTPFFPQPRVQLPVKKRLHLPLREIATIIHTDWMGKRLLGNGKGYYITGALTKEIYDEECLFDGPDPDMPVRGLRKYLLSASHLFDKQKSRADLIRPIEYDSEKGIVIAYWRLEGVLNLPWHPLMKPWTGSTTYHIEPESGLVVTHQEHWDISVPDAFTSTLFPWLRLGASAADPVDQLVMEPPRPLRQSTES